MYFKEILGYIKPISKFAPLFLQIKSVCFIKKCSGKCQLLGLLHLHIYAFLRSNFRDESNWFISAWLLSNVQ